MRRERERKWSPLMIVVAVAAAFVFLAGAVSLIGVGLSRRAERERAESAEVERRLREAALALPSATTTTTLPPTPLESILFDAPPAGYIVPAPDPAFPQGRLDAAAVAAQSDDPRAGGLLLDETGFSGGIAGTWLRQGDAAFLIVEVLEFATNEGATRYNSAMTTGDLLEEGAAEFVVTSPPGRGIRMRVTEEGVQVDIAVVHWVEGRRTFMVGFGVTQGGDTEAPARAFAQGIFDRSRPRPA